MLTNMNCDVVAIIKNFNLLIFNPGLLGFKQLSHCIISQSTNMFNSLMVAHMFLLHLCSANVDLQCTYTTSAWKLNCPHKLFHFAAFFDIPKTIKIPFLVFQGPFSFTVNLKRLSGSKRKRGYNATV